MRKLKVIYFIHSVRRGGGSHRVNKVLLYSLGEKGGGSHRVNKVKIFFLLICSFCSYLTKIYHFCPFFVRFCPFLSDFVHFCQFFFSKKYNFRPFKAILDQFWPFLSIFCPFLSIGPHVCSVNKILYLPPEASELYWPSVNYVFFGLVAALLGQIFHFCPRRCAPRAKNTYLASSCSSSAKKYIVDLGSIKLTFSGGR